MSCPAAWAIGPFLAPAGHASVDQLLVARQAVVGPEAQTFGDAGSKPLEQRVGGLHQLEHQFDALGLLEVHGDGTPVTCQHIARAAACSADAVNADHLRAHVREHHPAERPRPDAGEFDDAKTLQWSHRCLPPVSYAVQCKGFADPRDSVPV